MFSGRTSEEDSTTLPPCRVCYGKASGFHYGLNTCEACKAFFRRSQKKFQLYKCNKSSKCEIAYEKRGLCTYCRYQKCTSLGMGRHAIKTGRYTHEKKARDIKEVKGLHQWTHEYTEHQLLMHQKMEEEEQIQQENRNQGQQRLLRLWDQVQHDQEGKQLLQPGQLKEQQRLRQQDQGQLLDQQEQQQLVQKNQKQIEKIDQNERMDHDSVQKQSSEQESHLEVRKSEDNIQEQLKSTLLSSGYIEKKRILLAEDGDDVADTAACMVRSSSCSSHDLGVVSPEVSFQSDLSVGRSPVACSSTDVGPDSAHCSTSFIDRPDQLSSQQTAYDKSKISYYEEIIQKIIKVYKAQTPHTDEFYDSAWPEKEKDYLEKAELRSKVFGNLRNMSLKEYFVFYQETGIDVDGRFDLIRTVYIPYIEDCIKRCINFAKAIPGFSRICLADQIMLIKTSRYGCWTITSHKSFNIQHRLYMTVEGEIISFNDMIKLNDPEFMDGIFLLQSKIKQLRLTLEETCILAAFVVVFIDKSDVQDIDQIEECQELLLHCLLYLFDKHHPEDRMRLPKCVDCLILMRTLRDLQMKDEERVANEWSGIIDMPPLFYEMWSS